MNFLRSIFSCCRPDVEYEAEHEDNLQQEIQANVKSMRLKRSNTSSSSSCKPLLFPAKLIREDELGKIDYTKQGIIAFIDSLCSLDYVQLYTDDTLTISIRKEGSPITSEFFLAKAVKTIPKSLFDFPMTKADIAKVIYNPLERMKWDKGIKRQERVETFTEETYINRTLSNRFLMIISERDFVDKRVEWTDVETGTYYNFQTSIPEEIYPSQEGVVRVKTFLNAFVVREDEEKIDILYLNQIDIKMSIPQKMAEVTAPLQIKEWYRRIVLAVNAYLKEKNNPIDEEKEGILS